MKSLMEFFRPHLTIPQVPWRARNKWDLNFTRFLILLGALTIFGLGDALFVQSSLGNAPWTVLAQGISDKTGLTIGLVTGLISLAVLLLWIPLREKPGFATLMNIVVIATAIQIGITCIPEAPGTVVGLLYCFSGVTLVGIGSAFYISVGLGSGPRDGAMTGIHHRTGVRIGRVRLAIEVTVLTLGALLGGHIGLGTAIFAAFIGQSIAINCGILARLTSRP